MSELDKEAVLDEFSAAYKEAHGKKPKVEDSNGWYSVDGGKNMRLAQIDEWTKELRADKAKSAAKSSKSSTTKKATSSTEKSTSKKKSSAAKSAAKKPTEKKSTAKKSAKKKAGTKKSTAKPAKKKSAGSDGSGQTPAQAWQAHLEQQAGASRLPRGFKG